MSEHPSSEEKNTGETGVSNASHPIHESLRHFLARVFARSENFVAGRFWSFEALFLAVLVSVLFSAGIDRRLWYVSDNHWYNAYFQKIEHPLADVAKMYPADRHEAKLNFRLTVPVVLHLLRVPANERWTLPVLAACATCVIIFAVCVFVFRVTGDRVCGLYAALAVACTYIGSFGCVMYYDSLAIAQVVVAMLPGVPWLVRGLLVFTAGFTDERALLASLFLLVQPLCSAPSKTLREHFLKPRFLVVIGGLIAYCITRFALVRYAGLTSPMEDVGWSLIKRNFLVWHSGIWLALKGGWFLMALATFGLWRQRRISALAAFIFVTALVIGGGFLVEDVVRSTAYVLPGFLIAIMVCARCENIHWLRIYCFSAFIISLVAGNYTSMAWQEPPLLAKFFYQFLSTVTPSAALP